METARTTPGDEVWVEAWLGMARTTELVETRVDVWVRGGAWAGWLVRLRVRVFVPRTGDWSGVCVGLREGRRLGPLLLGLRGLWLALVGVWWGLWLEPVGLRPELLLGLR